MVAVILGTIVTAIPSDRLASMRRELIHMVFLPCLPSRHDRFDREPRHSSASSWYLFLRNGPVTAKR